MIRKADRDGEVIGNMGAAVSDPRVATDKLSVFDRHHGALQIQFRAARGPIGGFPVGAEGVRGGGVNGGLRVVLDEGGEAEVSIDMVYPGRRKGIGNGVKSVEGVHWLRDFEEEFCLQHSPEKRSGPVTAVYIVGAAVVRFGGMIQVAQENGVGGKWGIFEQLNLASPAGVVVSRVEVAVEEGDAGEWVASVRDGGLQNMVVYDGAVVDGAVWETGGNDGQNPPRGAAVTVEAYVVAGKVGTEFSRVVVRARSDVLDAGDVMGQG
jgi:hypothetical protein